MAVGIKYVETFEVKVDQADDTIYVRSEDTPQNVVFIFTQHDLESILKLLKDKESNFTPLYR